MGLSSKLLRLEVGARWTEARPGIWDTKLNPQGPNESIFMSSRLTTVSKYLSKYLRHAPGDLGLTLHPGGWVPVDDLLAAADRGGFPITYDELVECVETNDKQRFSFDITGELIRANQGHSVEVDLQLEEREPPEILYHGRVGRYLVSIMAEGLEKGTRHHVHLTIAVQALASRRGITEPIGAARSDGA
jgi:putative RNA 2'-phosphotransferase